MDGITDSMDMSLSKLWEMMRRGKPSVLQSMGSQRVGQTEQLNNIWALKPALKAKLTRSLFQYTSYSHNILFLCENVNFIE